MAFQSKYKSRWTGPQIDDSIGKVQGSSTTPTPGGIAIYDSNGNLKTSKPVADNDTVRLQDVTNPNLLINGDFRVNQRGKESYSNQYEYTVDRWQLRQNGITLTPISGGGISVVKNTANVNIWQILEMPLATLAGKTITISGKCGGTIFTASGTVPSTKTSSSQKVCEVHATNNWLSFNVSRITDTNYDMYFEIAAQGNFSYEWVKLELGEVATSFYPRPYSEELAMCQMPFYAGSISTTFSNPNLLINGDFRVNQRGFSTDNSFSGYTVDRWYKQYAGATQITLNSDNTITATQLSSTGTEMTSALQQSIESSDVYIGKSVTASVNVTNVVGSYWFLVVSARNDSSQLSYEQINISSTGIKSVTLNNIPSGTKYLRFTIAVWRQYSSNNDNITFKECKLELGDVATAFTPKNYSEELADCQMPYMGTGTSTTYSNHNLLINGNFQVNQRGQTSWSSVSTYTVDCWHINGDATLTYSNGNMTFVGGGVSQDYFVQYLDPTKLKLWGKTVTMSCEFSDGKILVTTGTFPASFSSADSIIPQTGYYNSIALRGYLYNANKFGFTLDVGKNANGTIKWCKMEIGDTLTPFISKSYVEELAACQMPNDNNGISTTYSNPNLLINGDFKINQRGLTTSAVGKYNFDRWKSWISNATFTFDTTANCLKIVVTGTGQTYQQYLELATSEQLYGKTLTLSAELSSDGVTFYKYSNTRATISSTGGNSTINVLGGAQLTQGTSAEGLVYAHLKLADNQTLYVRYMKLEVGSVATPFSPRPYAEELEMCKRYCLVLTSDTSTKFYAMTFAYSTTSVGAFIPCKLRTSPTITWANLHYRSGSQNTASVSAASVNGFTTEAVSLQITTTAVAGESGLLRASSTSSYIALEAEI